MPVAAVGIEHEKAPLDLVEKARFTEENLVDLYSMLAKMPQVYEAVVLSTCLRTEIYAVTDRFHATVDQITSMLSRSSGVAVSKLEESFTVLYDDDVASHLFAVASGLRSAVLGESEVLGQVKRASEAAAKARLSGQILTDLFRHAVRVGKEVRARTAISQGPTSLAHVAADLARSAFGNTFEGRKVVIVGAGEMGEQLAGAITKHGMPREVVVASRTTHKARDLASRIPAASSTGYGLANLTRAITGADAVFVSLAATSHVLGTAAFDAVASADEPGTAKPGTAKLAREVTAGARPTAPASAAMVVVDLGMPRNVDPRVGEMEGIRLYSMDDLRSRAERAVEGRKKETAAAEEIIAREVSAWRNAQLARGAVPTLTALRGRVEAIRRDEIAKAQARSFGALDDAAWAEVDRITKAVVAKLLHNPTVALKGVAGTTRGDVTMEVVRSLFGL